MDRVLPGSPGGNVPAFAADRQAPKQAMSMRTTEKLKCGCWSGVILLLRAAAGSAASGPPNAEALV